MMPASGQAGATFDRVRATGILTGAVSDGFPPVAFLNEKNELTGFDIEVAREIAARLGVRFETAMPSWEDTVAGQWQGRWDIAVGSMTPTADRAKVLDFPAVYYYTPAAFAVHKTNRKVRTVRDLNGKTIGACAACTYEQYLKGTLVIDAEGALPFEFQVRPGRLEVYESEGRAFDDLRLGDGVRLDAVLSNLQTIHEAIRTGLPLRVVGDPVFFEPLAIAVDKGDPEFTTRIREIVETMRADGTLARLSLKWFGMDLTRPK